MSEASSASAQILIVDQDAGHGAHIKKQLVDAGYGVRLAVSGHEGLSIIRTGSVDVALCEMNLPDVPGLSWLEQARLGDPGVQVIMMASEIEVDMVREAMRRQASDFVNKPVIPNALLRSIRTALSIKSVDDERRNLVVILARKNAEVEDLAEMRSALLQLLRHDLANLISGAAAALVRRKRSIEEFQQTEDMVLQMLEQGEAVIEEVRRRAEGKPVGLAEREDVSNLSHLVKLSLTTMESQAEAKRIALRANIPPDLAVRVRPGPFVMHVLNNLVSNAIKFSFPDTSIQLEAHSEDDWVVLTVQDCGCGIAPDRLASLFDHPNSTTGTMGERGTGYGLRHAKLSLADIGGSIEVTSVPNESGVAVDGCGTCFTMRIRRHVPPVSETPAEDSASANDSVDLPSGNPGLLIIDDAWPVTDGLCLALVDMFKTQTDQIYRVDYIRVQPAPRMLQQNKAAENMRFRSLLDNTGGDREASFNAAFSAHNPTEFPVVILQDKASIALFYSRLSDPSFLRRLKRTFSVYAVDYALGLPVTGTDILSSIGDGAKRVLISANAEEHLPADYNSCCEMRIQKASIRLPTLAERLMEQAMGEAMESESEDAKTP